MPIAPSLLSDGYVDTEIKPDPERRRAQLACTLTSVAARYLLTSHALNVQTIH